MSADLETLLSRADLVVDWLSNEAPAGRASGPYPTDAAIVAQMARMLRNVQAAAPCDHDSDGDELHACGVSEVVHDVPPLKHEYEPPAWLRSALTPDADGDGGR